MMKLDFLVLKFTEYLKVNGFAERTVVNYIQNIGCFMDHLKELKIENIAEVDRQVLADYQSRIHLQEHKGKPLSSATKQLRLISVRMFFRYLVKSGFVTYDPTSKMDLPKMPKPLPKGIMNKKEIGELLSVPNLETPRGIRDRAILELLYSSGIRVTELCNLTLNDIDLNNGEIRVNKGKNNKDRIVPLGDLARDFIELYLHESRLKLVTSDQQYLFVNKKGSKYSRSHIHSIIMRQGRKVGLKASPHRIRHTCATHLLKGKADIRHIQLILGHASISTTQRYTQVEISDLKKVIRRCHPREKGEIVTNG